jgi:hypothetical protein
MKYFTEYAKTEYSLENILVYQDIFEYKKTNKGAFEIYQKYFNGRESLMEVNVEKKDCDLVLQKINRFRRDSQRFPLDDKLFETLELAVKLNLVDTFTRFKLTNEYKNYVKNQNLQIELLEKDDKRSNSASSTKINSI